jgi:hypothetical protein
VITVVKVDMVIREAVVKHVTVNADQALVTDSVVTGTSVSHAAILPPAQEPDGGPLELIKRYSIEAVFSGHVHHFFYNRHHASLLYVLPPTSFIRQDYSELFPIEPASEYGRDDVGKYGVTFVDVFERGHTVRVVPTEGAELEESRLSDVATPVPATLPTARRNRLVAHLRHAWATPIALP